jgi:hypothetical protein
LGRRRFPGISGLKQEDENKEEKDSAFFHDIPPLIPLFRMIVIRDGQVKERAGRDAGGTAIVNLSFNQGRSCFTINLGIDFAGLSPNALLTFPYPGPTI